MELPEIEKMRRLSGDLAEKDDNGDYRLHIYDIQESMNLRSCIIGEYLNKDTFEDAIPHIRGYMACSYEIHRRKNRA